MDVHDSVYVKAGRNDTVGVYPSQIHQLLGLGNGTSATWAPYFRSP